MFSSVSSRLRTTTSPDARPTRSPGAIPSLRAVPATTSRTARTRPPDGIVRRDSAFLVTTMVVFSLIRHHLVEGYRAAARTGFGALRLATNG